MFNTAWYLWKVKRNLDEIANVSLCILGMGVWKLATRSSTCAVVGFEACQWRTLFRPSSRSHPKTSILSSHVMSPSHHQTRSQIHHPGRQLWPLPAKTLRHRLRHIKPKKSTQGMVIAFRHLGQMNLGFNLGFIGVFLALASSGPYGPLLARSGYPGQDVSFYNNPMVWFVQL